MNTIKTRLLALSAAMILALSGAHEAEAAERTFEGLAENSLFTMSIEGGGPFKVANSGTVTRAASGTAAEPSAKMRTRPERQNCYVRINGECQKYMGSWGPWMAITSSMSVSSGSEVDFQMQAGPGGTERTESLSIAGTTETITLSAFSETRPDAVDIHLGRYMASSASQEFTSNFNINHPGSLFFYPEPGGNAQYKVTGLVEQCTQCWAFSNGVCTDCRQYGMVESLKQDWTGTAITSVGQGDKVEVRMSGPAIQGGPEKIARLVFPSDQRAQMSVAWVSDPFSDGFRDQVDNPEKHIFFHDANPDQATIRTLRESTIESRLTISGLVEGLVDPVNMTVPAEIDVLVNNVPIVSSLLNDVTGTPVENGDVVTFRVAGSDTGLFNADNTVGAGPDACPIELTNDGATDCRVFDIRFSSNEFTETRTWAIGRGPVDMSPGTAEGAAVDVADFPDTANAVRSLLVTSEARQITTTATEPTDVTVSVSVESDPGSDILLSDTTIIVDGVDTDVRSTRITVSDTSPVDLAIRTTVKPKLGGGSGGEATLLVKVGDREARWTIYWSPIRPSMATVYDAVNNANPGLGARLQTIIDASVAHYDLDPQSNIFIDHVLSTPISRIMNFLEANPDLAILTPRVAVALENATQDSKRPYGERVDDSPINLEGIFFEDIMNAPLSSLVSTSTGGVLTENVAGALLNLGESAPLLVLQQAPGLQFRTSPDCGTLDAAPWQSITAASQMTVGDCLQLRLLSASAYNTLRSVRLFVGDANIVWRVKTRTVPLSMQDYTTINNADWGTVTESLEARPILNSDGTPITETIEPLLARPTGEGTPQICVVSSATEACSGGWTDNAVVVDETDYIRLRLTAPDDGGQSHIASVILGDISAPDAPEASLTVSTSVGAPPILENNLGTDQFVDLFHQPTGELTYSNEIVLRQDASDPAGHWYVQAGGAAAEVAVSVNNGSYQTGVIQVFPDDRLRLRHRTAPTDNTQVGSILDFYSFSDPSEPSILSRTWNTTTGSGIQSCNVAGKVQGRRGSFRFGKDSGDPYQGSSVFRPVPGIIPGDEVAIDLRRLDEIEEWVANFTPDYNRLANHFWNGYADETRAVEWNARGFFDDVTCEQSNGVGFTPTAIDPGEPFFLEIEGYVERYNSNCCTAPEFAYHAYPYGRAVNDPISEPLIYDRAGGNNRSIVGDIPYTGVDNYAGRADPSEVGNYALTDLNWEPESSPARIAVIPEGAEEGQIGAPDSGGVASDYYIPSGEFDLEDPDNAYLIINGVPSGRGAMIYPEDSVELGLRVSEGMYRYDVTLLANGYARRKVELDTTMRTPRGIVEPRGQDFGVLEIAQTGETSHPNVFTIPPVNSDPENWYPDAIRSLRGSFDMRGPLVTVFAPLNHYAEALLRGSEYSDYNPDWCDHSTNVDIHTTVPDCLVEIITDSASGSTGMSVTGVEAANFTVVTPYLTHGDTTHTSPDPSELPGPANRRVSGLSGENIGFRVREGSQLHGPAEFGIFLLNYQDLPNGVPYTFNRKTSTHADHPLASFSNIQVPNGSALTAYGMAPQSWHDGLLGTFTIQHRQLTLSQEFGDLTGQLTNATAYSAEVQFTEVPASLAVSITGGEFQINGGPWVTTGSIVNGDFIRMRHTTASTTNETVTSTLSVGSLSYDWSTTTGSTEVVCSNKTIGTAEWGIWQGDRVGIALTGTVPTGGTELAIWPDIAPPSPSTWTEISEITGGLDLCGVEAATPIEMQILSVSNISSPVLYISDANNSSGVGDTFTYTAGDTLELQGTFTGNWSITFGTEAGSHRYMYSGSVRNSGSVSVPFPPSGLGTHNYGSPHFIGHGKMTTSNAFTLPPLSLTEAEWYSDAIRVIGNTSLPYNHTAEVEAFALLHSGIDAADRSVTDTSVATQMSEATALQITVPDSGTSFGRFKIGFGDPLNPVSPAGDFLVYWNSTYSGGTEPVSQEPTTFLDSSHPYNTVGRSNILEVQAWMMPGGTACQELKSLPSTGGYTSPFSWQTSGVLSKALYKEDGTRISTGGPFSWNRGGNLCVGDRIYLTGSSSTSYNSGTVGIRLAGGDFSETWTYTIE